MVFWLVLLGVVFLLLLLGNGWRIVQFLFFVVVTIVVWSLVAAVLAIMIAIKQGVL